MAGTTFVWVALAVWVLGGLAGYYYLYRHGHPSPVWLLGGLILGPFSLLVFIDRVERTSHVLVERPAVGASGTKVVVGLDGSPESEHALQVATTVMGDRPCCLVLCEVVDYDTETDPSGAGVAAASDRLDAVAKTLTDHNVTVEVVAGRPAQALADVAERHDADILVVGTRGRGVSRRLLGSVAEGLLAESRRPVMVTHRGSG
jgi:nucleotide-binding universal stress UspA family protein